MDCGHRLSFLSGAPAISIVFPPSFLKTWVALFYHAFKMSQPLPGPLLGGAQEM